MRACSAVCIAAAASSSVRGSSAVSQPTAELWLSPDPRIENLEAQLSDLTARAQLFEQRAQPFGLRLARREVPIGVGPAHLRQVLQELALC